MRRSLGIAAIYLVALLSSVGSSQATTVQSSLGPFSGGGLNSNGDITFDETPVPLSPYPGNPAISTGSVPPVITSPIGPVTFTGTGIIVNNAPGTANGISATPAGDLTNYLSVLGGHSETLSLPSLQTNFGLYWGSIDAYNEIQFFVSGNPNAVATYYGNSLDAVPPVGSNGDQSSLFTNAYIKFLGLPNYNEVVLSSSTNSFELDNIGFGDRLSNVGPIPEPSTWVMLILGFASIGWISYRRRNRAIRLAAPRLTHS
jgi:hypothetical protein